MAQDTQTKTPKSVIKGNLRRLFLKSRERGTAIKRDAYTCQKCGIKASKAKGSEVKVQVHHKHGICNWDHLINEIYKGLLCDPEFLETLCVDCHKAETYFGR